MHTVRTYQMIPCGYGHGQFHFMKHWTIQKALQAIKDDAFYKTNPVRISIISGCLAQRGVSFVSEDYEWHLTDEYYSRFCLDTGENLVQSLRLLGNYKKRTQLKLWTTDVIWKEMRLQYMLIQNAVRSLVQSISIQDIPLHTTSMNMMRNKLMNHVSKRHQDGNVYFQFV